MDFTLCRRYNLEETGDYKVEAGESVARQHWMVVGCMTSEMKKRKNVRVEL